MSLQDYLKLRHELHDLASELRKKIEANTRDIAQIAVAMPDEPYVPDSEALPKKRVAWILIHEYRHNREIIGLFDTGSKAHAEKDRLKSEGWHHGYFTVEEWEMQ